MNAASKSLSISGTIEIQMNRYKQYYMTSYVFRLYIYGPYICILQTLSKNAAKKQAYLKFATGTVLKRVVVVLGLYLKNSAKTGLVVLARVNKVGSPG